MKKQGDNPDEPVEPQILHREGWTSPNFDERLRGRVTHRLDGSEWFMLTDRTFEMLDVHMNYKFLALILKMLKLNPDRPITIVDAGGGMDSRALRGILSHPFLQDRFPGRIRTINVDPFGFQPDSARLKEEGIDPTHLQILEEEFDGCTLPDKTADIIFSWQVLDHVSDTRLPRMIEGAARLLKPGGEALLQEQWRINRSTDLMRPWHIFPLSFMPAQEGDWLQEIANRHNITIKPTWAETTLDGRTHIFGGGTPLLHLTKNDYERGIYSNSGYNEAFPEIQEAVKKY